MQTLRKQPSERYPVAIEYAGRLPSGTTLASGVVAAVETSAWADVSGALLDATTCTVSGTQLLFVVKGGVHTRDYRLTVRATLTPGSYVLEDDLLVQVREE